MKVKKVFGVVAAFVIAATTTWVSPAPQVEAANANNLVYEYDANGSAKVVKPEAKRLMPVTLNDGGQDASYPQNLRWDDVNKGWAYFEKGTGEAYYFLKLYRDGKQCGEWHLGELKYETPIIKKKGNGFIINTANDFKQSGTYTFKVKAAVNDNDSEFESGKISTSGEYTYDKPLDSIGTPTNPRWSTTKPGVALWDPVDNAAAYMVWLQVLEPGASSPKGSIGLYVYGGNSSSVDFSNHIGDTSADVKYRFVVSAYSPNIELYAHGVNSQPSEYWAGSRFPGAGNSDAKSATNNIKNAQTATQAQSALDSFVKSVDKDALALNLQSNSDARNELTDMENVYKSKAKVTVSNNVTVKGIDSSKVSIIGAGLNANANENVSFNISNTNESSKKAINTNLYKNIVQLDLNISNAGRVSADGKLAVPVVITMPVPLGMNPTMMYILHFHHSDDGFDLIHPRINSDGTISFTVTNFSTFAFVDTLNVGDAVTDSKSNNYKVTGNDTVEFVAPKSKKATSVKIADTVVIGDSTYKVTSIADGACKSMKKLKSVTIGANVKTIGKNAFKGCKKLNKINVNAKSLKTIGKKAFDGVSSKCKITITISKKSKYNKVVSMFKSKGAKKATFKMKKGK